MVDIPIREGNIPRDDVQETDFSNHFKIVMDDFFVIYAVNIDRFLSYLKFVHDVDGINMTHGKYIEEGDDDDAVGMFPGIHTFLRKILSPPNIAIKQDELHPPAGVFKIYQVWIHPPNCHVDSVEDHDMCMTPNYTPALLADPNIIPHTEVNANADRACETLDLAHTYMNKLFLYIYQDSYQINHKFRPFLRVQTPDGAILHDKELVFDRDNQGGPDKWVDHVIDDEKKSKVYFLQTECKTKLISYQRIFYSYFSGHQFSDFRSNEDDVEDNIDFDRVIEDQRSFNGFLSFIDDVYRRGMARTRIMYDGTMNRRDEAVQRFIPEYKKWSQIK